MHSYWRDYYVEKLMTNLTANPTFSELYVYGYAEIGKGFIQACSARGIYISGIIDRGFEGKLTTDGLKVFTLDEIKAVEHTVAIAVTPLRHQESIKKELSQTKHCVVTYQLDHVMCEVKTKVKNYLHSDKKRAITYLQEALLRYPDEAGIWQMLAELDASEQRQFYSNIYCLLKKEEA